MYVFDRTALRAVHKLVVTSVMVIVQKNPEDTVDPRHIFPEVLNNLWRYKLSFSEDLKITTIVGYI